MRAVRECTYRSSSVLVAQSCPTLCDPMDCNPPGSSVHGIVQARILELVAISVSRGSYGRHSVQVLFVRAWLLLLVTVTMRARTVPST